MSSGGMGERVTVSSPTVYLLGLLTIAFIVLKLTGIITWSWWLVLLPAWGPLALAAVFVVIFVGLFVLARKGR